MNWVYLVKKLRIAGMSIEAIVKYTKLNQEEKTLKLDLAQKNILCEQLEKINKKILELEEARDLLEYKIDNYSRWALKYNRNFGNEAKKLWELNKRK